MAEASMNQFRRMMETMQFETLPLFSKPYFSWNLKTDYVGRRFVYRPVSESTLDDAQRMMERFRLSNGALLLAETQTAGKGRLGRAWVSPPDVNLYFTVILTPPNTAAMATLPYVTPLALALAIEEVAGAHEGVLRPDLKWPNDLLVGDRKLAGVLIEASQTADGDPVAFVGVGVNVNLEVADYREIAGIATSMKQELGHEAPREEVLAAFCNHFEVLYEQAMSGSSAPFESWRSRLINLGRSVVAQSGFERIEGRAVDVSSSGALVIQRADGTSVTVNAGDVTLQTPAGAT